MKKSYLFLMLFPTFTLARFAPEQEHKVAEPQLQIQKENVQQNITDLTHLSETEYSLLQDPELTRQVLNRAIDLGQFSLLPTLVNIYQQIKNYDPILVDYTKGIIAYHQQNYTQAILLFKQILSAHPNFEPVRFRLAKTLFEDYQYNAAKNELNKLQQKMLPKEIAQIITQYQLALYQRERWQFSAGINYLQENNVNNASKAEYIYVGNAVFKKNAEALPQSASGLSYGLNISKQTTLADHHSLVLENQFTGKSFWNNHQFDDQTNRVSFGYQYQRVHWQTSILPFYELRWYARHRYSQAAGGRIQIDHWLTPKWQLSFASEQTWLKHRPVNRLADSHSQFFSTTLLYALKQNHYLFGGADYLRDKTRDPSLSSIRRTVRLGFGVEWKNIVSRLQLSYGWRQFDRPHHILAQVRQDKELGVNLNLWHKKLNLWGITPKLVYSYQRVHSNIASLYSTQRQRIYLDFQWRF